MNTPVFNPADFRLLRRPCGRYDTPRSHHPRDNAHTPGQIETSVGSHLLGFTGYQGVALGRGCYHTQARCGDHHDL